MNIGAKTVSFFRARLKEVITFVLAALGLTAFFIWFFGAEEHTVYGAVAAVACFVLFMLSLMIGVPGAIRFFKGEEEQTPVDLMGERSSTRSRLHPWAKVFFTVLLSRFLLILIAYFVQNISRGYHGSVFSTLKDVWYKIDTDAPHYASIAENWYQTKFPEAWVLVFLPFYPLCIRALSFIIGNTFVSAFVLNLLFSSVAGVVMYELALCDIGRRSSRFAVFCAFALPAAIFYTAPMSEALFLLLSAASLLAMRRSRFLFAAIFGALAAFTRSLGIILLVPFAAEGARYCVITYKAAKAKEGEDAVKKLLICVLKLFLCALLLFCGTGAYLLINKVIWGDWFKFMQFQKENWYQSLGWFFSTASYQTELLVENFSTGEAATAIGLWLPNILYLFGALAVFIVVAGQVRTSYLLYFAAYFAVACGPTWLLSAPRYLTALAVLPIFIAKLCEGRDDGVGLARARAKSVAVASVLLVGQLIYLTLYVLRYKIY